MKHPLLDQMLATRIVTILRGLPPQDAVSIGDALAESGLCFLEVPLNSPNALDCIKKLSSHFFGSKIHIGAGTVLRASDVNAAKDAGAEYIISPNVNPSVIQRTCQCGLLSMPGFKTPTEAFSAIAAGANILKVFPCSSPHEITVLKSVIPLPIFAVGAITAENAAEYLQSADGVAVGIGIYRPGMTPANVHASALDFVGKAL